MVKGVTGLNSNFQQMRKSYSVAQNQPQNQAQEVKTTPKNLKNTTQFFLCVV